MKGFRRLILVPGHAVWSGAGDPREDASWHLKPFQNREPRLFCEHVEAGVVRASADQRALLVISGGASEATAGEQTEAAGYLAIAEWFGWWGHAEVRDRTVLEEYAMDSFENVLFALCRFREHAGQWPESITVCGWGFKARRIAGLHRAALRWGREFDYVAVNEPEDMAAVLAREAATRREWASDPYGQGAQLKSKREQRNHLRRAAPYQGTCPEIREMMAHSGPELFGGAVPW